jgi:hypothetical protein
MKLICDVVMAVDIKKKTADRDVRNSETGRIVCQNCEQKKWL